MKNKYIYLLLYVTCLTVLNACLDDVPHNNPFDPQNPNIGFSIKGQVTTYYQPQKTIPNAVITLMPNDKKVFADASGQFTFQNLKNGTYTIFCQAEGYKIDSLDINLNNNKDVHFALPGLPYFEKTTLTTEHTSHWFPVDDMYFLNINTYVNDVDGVSDIKRVYFRIPEYDYEDTLTVQTEAGHYFRQLLAADLPISSIHELTGLAFYIYVEDDLGNITESTQQFLTRIIDLTPQVVSPINLETVPADSVVLTWDKVRLPYTFSLSIALNRINLGILIPIDEIMISDPLSTSVQYTKSLSSGDYVWIITITDELGNTSSSKEGTFKI